MKMVINVNGWFDVKKDESKNFIFLFPDDCGNTIEFVIKKKDLRYFLNMRNEMLKL